jgi:hypothetical protein
MINDLLIVLEIAIAVFIGNISAEIVLRRVKK